MLINPNSLTHWIIDHFDLWQMDFLNPDRLYFFCKDRSIIFWADHITQLWQLGWLRADLITSQTDTKMAEINLINEDKGVFYYSDDRHLGLPQPDLEESVRSLSPLPDGMIIYFHPFKYYVLYQIQRVVRTHINPFQVFIKSQFPKMLDGEIHCVFR